MDAQQLIEFGFTRNANAVTAEQRATVLEDPGFGRYYTDHMVTIRWTAGTGWHDAKVEPRAPFLLDPAAAVLHYAQEIFEGMKAYRLAVGGVALFRPYENARRFNESATRMAMPELPEALFVEAVEKLIKVDQDWVPGGDASLYLRPFMFANEPFLGVRPANEFIFCVIATPAGAYFKSKTALSLWVSEDFTRAGQGGTGAAKCGGNYAASLAAQAEAIKQGCDQVIFLDSAEHRWIEELGGMNIFFVMADGSLLTPPLGGTILPGITRASIMTLARERGMAIREERYSIDQWRADAASGAMREAFACGTAAVIAPIGTVISASDRFTIGNGDGGATAEELRVALTGMQRGVVEGPADWLHEVAL